MLVSLGFSARSEQRLMVPMCRGRSCRRRGTSDSGNSGHGKADRETLALPLLPQGYPLTISCLVSAYRSMCADTAWDLVSSRFYLRPEESWKSLQSLTFDDQTAKCRRSRFWFRCCWILIGAQEYDITFFKVGPIHFKEEQRLKKRKKNKKNLKCEITEATK